MRAVDHIELPERPRRGRGWSPEMHELADHIGERATLLLCAAVGGVDVRIPASPRPDWPLARVLGPAATRRLCEVYGGERLDVPCGATAIRMARAEVLLPRVATGGTTMRAIALALGVSYRHVKKIAGQLRIATPDERPLGRVAIAPARRRRAAAAAALQTDLFRR